MNLSDAIPTDLAPLQPRTIGSPVPVTESQIWHWNENHERPLSTRLRAAAVRILGSLDIGLLRQSIETVAHCQESLRTRIVMGDGALQQHIDSASEYQLDVVKLCSLGREDREVEAGVRAQEFLTKKIDLSVGPLFGAKLLRLSDDEHVLLLALDHIVGDAISCGILSSDIWSLYSQAAKGLSPLLPSLPLQFGDYALWLEQTRASRQRARGAYWAQLLEGAPRTQIPADECVTELETPVGASRYFPFGKAASDRVRDLAKREEIPVPIVILTAFLVVISRWCRQHDLDILFAYHGRYGRPELQNMIGCLVRILYFRIQVSETESLVSLLRRVQRVFLSCTSNHDVVPYLPQNFTELMFHWGGMPSYSSRWSPGLQRAAGHQLKIMPFQEKVIEELGGGINLKFFPFFSDTPAGIVARVGYRPDRLAPTTIDRYGTNLRLVADTIAKNPFARLESVVFG
jgi:Condensation domain